MHRVVYILLSICWAKAQAQSDSSKLLLNHPLPIVTVTTSKYSSGVEPLMEKVDLDENVKSGLAFLSGMLATQSDVYINAGSGASLATASVRGTTSEQTPVLWCGINLQNPANGSIDLSLLPGFLFSSAEVVYGGTATLNGSGHAGGAINLSNNALFADTSLISFLTGYGSFHNAQVGIKILKAHKNVFNRTTLYYTSGINNFSFYNRAEFNAPLQTLTNAAYRELHVMQENSIKLNKSQIIDIKYWYTQSHRELSPTMTTFNDSSYQNDISHRFMLAWQYCGSKMVWYIRQHVLFETLNYYDGTAKMNYPSKSLLASSEIENHYYPSSKWHITSGVHYISAHAITDGYNQWHYRNETAIYLSAKDDILKYISLSASAREELVAYNLIRPVFSTGANCNITKECSVSMEWSEHYRLPTLNDLYWIPGGNLRLKPEGGNLLQLTTHYGKRLLNTECHLSFAVYANKLLNQIVWLPINAEIWSPVNYALTWSRGLNITASVFHSFGKYVVKLTSNNSYTRANQTNIAVTSFNGDNQLIYTPRYKTFNNLRITHTHSTLFVSGTYTTKVFTDENRAYYLNGYLVPDIGVENLFIMSHMLDMCVTFTAHNFSNTRYEVLIYRPQPLRYYTLTLIFKFKTI